MTDYDSSNHIIHGEAPKGRLKGFKSPEWSEYIRKEYIKKEMEQLRNSKKAPLPTAPHAKLPPFNGHLHQTARNPYGALARVQELAQKLETTTSQGVPGLVYNIQITQENLEKLIYSSDTVSVAQEEATYLEDQIIEYGDGLSTEFLSGLRAAAEILTRNGHLSDFIDEN